MVGSGRVKALQIKIIKKQITLISHLVIEHSIAPVVLHSSPHNLILLIM